MALAVQTLAHDDRANAKVIFSIFHLLPLLVIWESPLTVEILSLLFPSFLAPQPLALIILLINF